MLGSIAMRHYVELMRAKGIGADAVLRDSGIDASQLDDTDCRLDAMQYRGVIASMLAICEDGGIGLEVGAQRHLSDLGLVGYTAMTCTTVRDTHRLWTQRGCSLIGILGQLEIVDEDAQTVSFGLARENSFDALLGFVVEETLTMVQAAGKTLVDQSPMFKNLALSYAAPRHAYRYQEVFACPVRFAAARTRVTIKRDWFDQSLRSRDADLNHLFLRHCDDLLSRSLRDAPTVSALQQLLTQQAGPLPRLDEAARLLKMSPRSLRRRLLEEGTSFQAQVDKLRAAQSCEHLRSGWSAADTAQRLGFTDTGSFRQAFKGWTGQTVGDYRARFDRRAAGISTSL